MPGTRAVKSTLRRWIAEGNVRRESQRTQRIRVLKSTRGGHLEEEAPEEVPEEETPEEATPGEVTP